MNISKYEKDVAFSGRPKEQKVWAVSFMKLTPFSVCFIHCYLYFNQLRLERLIYL